MPPIFGNSKYTILMRTWSLGGTGILLELGAREASGESLDYEKWKGNAKTLLGLLGFGGLRV